MNKRMKRNLLMLTVVMFVSAAAYLNWNYAQGVADAGKILGESQLVEGNVSDEEADLKTEQEVFNEENDYFDEARLNRQKARDSAVALLKETTENEKETSAAKDEAREKIQKIADETLKESAIENRIIAKGYRDCVAFLRDDAANVVVQGEKGTLDSSDIAKVTDIVMEETGFIADKIKITEAKK